MNDNSDNQIPYPATEQCREYINSVTGCVEAIWRLDDEAKNNILETLEKLSEEVESYLSDDENIPEDSPQGLGEAACRATFHLNTDPVSVTCRGSGCPFPGGP